MMPVVIADPDNLDEKNADFTQVPLKQHFFLNSVPKSGSHLMKNIIRMFVPVEVSACVVSGNLSPKSM